MIDLRPYTVAQFFMDDNAANPWVAGLSGVPVELVENGKFDSDTVWVKNYIGNGWSIAGGVAHWINISGDGYMKQTLNITSGKSCLLIYTISNATDANFQITPILGGTDGIANIEEDGTYTEIIVAGSDDSLLQFRARYIGAPGGGESFDLDNVFLICLDDFPCTGVFKDFAGNPFTNAHSVVGKINRALHFSGDEHIEVFDEGALNFTTQPFTIAIWIRRNRSGLFEHFLCRGLLATDGWILRFDNLDRLNFITCGSGWNDHLCSNDTITDTNWHLIMAVKNGFNSALFIDNVEVSYSAGPPLDNPVSSSRTLKIGNYDINWLPFQGDIDVLPFFDKALSQAERYFLWQNERGTNALHEVLRPRFTSLEGKPRIEAALSSLPRMIAIPSSKPRMESGIISP